VTTFDFEQWKEWRSSNQEGAKFQAWLLIPIGILVIFVVFAVISRTFREEEHKVNYQKKSNLVPISAVMLQDHDEFRPSLFNDTFMQAASPWSNNAKRPDTNFSEYVGALEGMYGVTNPKDEPVYDEGAGDSRVPTAGGDAYLDIDDGEELPNDGEGYLDMNDRGGFDMPVLRKAQLNVMSERVPITERIMTEEETRDQWRTEWDSKREMAKAIVAGKETAKPAEEVDASQDETKDAWQQEFERKREVNRLRMDALQEAESVHAPEGGGELSAPFWQKDFAKARAKAAASNEERTNAAGDSGVNADDSANNHILGLLRSEAEAGFRDGMNFDDIESPFGKGDDEVLDALVASAFTKGSAAPLPVPASATSTATGTGPSFRELRKGKKQHKKKSDNRDGVAMAF
jgi:hypothetical protein